MMRIPLLTVIAVLCATGAMGAAFVNGDFEDPYVTIKTAIVPTGWTTYATAGGFVWQLEPGGVQLPGSRQWCQWYTTVTSQCVGGLYQTFDTNPGWTYTIKGTAAAVHADMNARIGIVQGGWGGAITWLLTTPQDSLAWHSIGGGAGAPVVALGTSMTVVCEGFNDYPTAKTARVVKFDNIQVPEPASMMALLGGMLAFGIRRRK